MKYCVRLEFFVKSTDFADIIVEANSEIEAKSKAKLEYFNDPSGLDYYASNYMDSELISDFESEWQVTEIKKKEL